MALQPLPALAHDSDYWFDPLSWDSRADIDYKIDDSIPGLPEAPFEDEIHAGVHRWDSQCCIGTFNYIDAGNGARPLDPPCTWKDSAVDVWIFYAVITDPGVIAQHERCVVLNQQLDLSEIAAGKLTFDSGHDFETDADPETGEYSVDEVTTHEFGHDTGVYRGGNASEGSGGGHWPFGTAKCSTTGEEADWTMCPSAEDGVTNLIPLEVHDIDTFQNWY